MWSANRALGDVTNTIPLDIDALLVQQFYHTLSTAFASIAQHGQYGLEGWAFVFGEIAQDMHFATTHIGIDFDAWNKIYIQFGGCLCGFNESTCAVMVGQCQHAQADIFR